LEKDYDKSALFFGLISALYLGFPSIVFRSNGIVWDISVPCAGEIWRWLAKELFRFDVHLRRRFLNKLVEPHVPKDDESVLLHMVGDMSMHSTITSQELFEPDRDHCWHIQPNVHDLSIQIC
jgi:hypothetical protein